jgi:Fic family protein
MILGNFIQQPGGYRAFVPAPFPPLRPIKLSPKVILVNDAATLALGKLDGVAQLIPDIDFFTFMYVRKEAALSSNIEGTKATMHDVLKADIKITDGVPRDVENIIHYISAMNYGRARLKKMALTSSVVREIHQKLMESTQEGIGKTPGLFRTTQNWINGTRPDNAEFVPPPPHEIGRCISDFEKFLNTPQPYPPLIQAALMHAQFETIHPFLDGNGRTGRLLITLQLCHNKVLEHPILYLSEYFKRHRDSYFERLSDYHNKSDIDHWLIFFLEGVKDVAEQALGVSKAIVKLREGDMIKVHALGGKQAPSAVKLLMELYKQPIVDVATVTKVTGLSRPASNALVQKFVDIAILSQTNETVTYGREFSYSRYLELFAEIV